MNIPTKDFPLTFLVVQVYQQQIFSAVCMCVCVCDGGLGGEKTSFVFIFKQIVNVIKFKVFVLSEI